MSLYVCKRTGRERNREAVADRDKLLLLKLESRGEKFLTLEISITIKKEKTHIMILQNITYIRYSMPGEYDKFWNLLNEILLGSS